MKTVKKYKIKGYEDKDLFVIPEGNTTITEVWCKVYKDGKRAKELDGWFIKKTLVQI